MGRIVMDSIIMSDVNHWSSIPLFLLVIWGIRITNLQLHYDEMPNCI